MNKNSFDFKGKAALVTGGSRGLGNVIAMSLAEHGAKVAICGRKKENLDQVLTESRKAGFEMIGRTANVGKSDELRPLFSDIQNQFGRLDILVNNVGMNILTPSVAAADEALWDKILETNLKGSFLASSMAVPLMKKGGGGKIINISSVAARKAAMGMGIYCVAKAGLDMLTRVLAVELAQDNIQVNGIAPGMIRTHFSKPFWGNEDLHKKITGSIPVGRIAEPQDILGAVLFLASGLSDYITGETLLVDGGGMA